jgi:hypothetical protein
LVNHFPLSAFVDLHLDQTSVNLRPLSHAFRGLQSRCLVVQRKYRIDVVVGALKDVQIFNSECFASTYSASTRDEELHHPILR